MACYFCQKNVDEIDFKNIEILSRFVSGMYKIRGRRKSGLCARHQRGISQAIKRSRQLGLMPYLPK